jgi:hypothetical protein
MAMVILLAIKWVAVHSVVVPRRLYRIVMQTRKILHVLKCAHLNVLRRKIVPAALKHVLEPMQLHGVHAKVAFALTLKVYI